MRRKEGRVSVQKIWNKKAPLLAFGGKEKGRVSPFAPSLSVHVVSPAGKGRFFFSLLSGFFLIQIRMSRAQCLVRTIVSRKKVSFACSRIFSFFSALPTWIMSCVMRCSLAGPGKGMRRSVGSVEDESGIRARCSKRTARLATAESAIETLACASD
jgi:hypothetical protein